MPLPEDDATWPPTDYKPAFDLIDTHDAWYQGEPARLHTVYRSQQSNTHAAQYAGGLVGFAARLWWGKPIPEAEASRRLHLPLPSDIATMSADLLFSEPPRIVAEASKTAADGTTVTTKRQEAVESVVNTPEAFTAFLEAAELAAAHGSAYLRLIWDRVSLEHVRIDAVAADCAVPTFRFGVLLDVLFWSEVTGAKSKDGRLRHVELHERGKITHALYRGDSTQLGRRVPLDQSPDTEWLARLAAGGEDGNAPEGVERDDEAMTVGLLTGVKGLTATFIPNMLPNRTFRRDGLLREFGRSDFAGLEHAFDAIDEAFTSWARDIRLAKARIIVPSSYLDSNGPGKGAAFDTEREVYEGLDFLSSDPGSRTITPQQFGIRVADHERTITEWTRYVLRGAGYSPSTLGEQGAGVQRTATEVTAEERLSDRTRDKKINYWKSALRLFVVTWLELEANLYGRADVALTEPPEIRFPAESQQDQEELARISGLLAASQSASIMTRVRALHPEWDGTTVNAEVDRIKEEMGIGVMEPDGATFNGITDPMGAEEAAALDERRKAELEEGAS